MQVVVDKAGEGKAEKPLLDDPVHLLAGIGPETVNKLKDLAAQTKDKDIQLPFTKIETGRYFACGLFIMMIGVISLPGLVFAGMKSLFAN